MYDNLKEVLNQCGTELVKKYRENLRKNGHIATGKLFNSVKYELIINSDKIGIEVNLEDYWKYVENGRRSGKFPPLNKIEDWIRVKKILPSGGGRKLPTEKQLAYLIGRKIANEGTEGTHDLEDAQKWVENTFKYRIEMALIKDFNTESYELMKKAGLFT